MQHFDRLVPDHDPLDARPQEGDSPAESWARAIFAWHFGLIALGYGPEPALDADGEPEAI